MMNTPTDPKPKPSPDEGKEKVVQPRLPKPLPDEPPMQIPPHKPLDDQKM